MHQAWLWALPSAFFFCSSNAFSGRDKNWIILSLSVENSHQIAEKRMQPSVFGWLRITNFPDGTLKAFLLVGWQKIQIRTPENSFWWCHCSRMPLFVKSFALTLVRWIASVCQQKRNCEIWWQKSEWYNNIISMRMSYKMNLPVIFSYSFLIILVSLCSMTIFLLKKKINSYWKTNIYVGLSDKNNDLVFYSNILIINLYM